MRWVTEEEDVIEGNAKGRVVQVVLLDLSSKFSSKLAILSGF